MRNLTCFLVAIALSLQGYLVVAQSALSSKNLKAVLIVGPVESRTTKYIKHMDQIAALLSENGIQVEKLYNRKAKWKHIVKLAPECNFLIYSGHGSNMGVKGQAGGLCLSDREMISTSRMLSELKLKANSLVIMKSVCNAAGSSEGDPRDIGIKVAKSRVEHYAYPFLEMGAAAYYADNYDDGAYTFLEMFLAGVSVMECYRMSAERFAHIEFESEFPRNQAALFSISSSGGEQSVERNNLQSQGKNLSRHVPPKSYDIALVAPADFTVDLMK